MSGRSLEYWRRRWELESERVGLRYHLPVESDECLEFRSHSDECLKFKSSSEEEKIKIYTTLELLAAYSGFFRRLLGISIAWGGRTARFFKGMWCHHHGEAVQRAIQDYVSECSSTPYPPDDEYDVKTILEAVYDQIFIPQNAFDAIFLQGYNNTSINPEGDLARILQVIGEKTGVFFEDIVREQTGLSADDIANQKIGASSDQSKPVIFRR